jgi:hypothetical protein
LTTNLGHWTGPLTTATLCREESPSKRLPTSTFLLLPFPLCHLSLSIPLSLLHALSSPPHRSAEDNIRSALCSLVSKDSVPFHIPPSLLLSTQDAYTLCKSSKVSFASRYLHTQHFPVLPSPQTKQPILSSIFYSSGNLHHHGHTVKTCNNCWHYPQVVAHC